MPTNWMNVLGWKSDELEDLRFVGYSYIKQGQYDIALTFFEALFVLDQTSAYDRQTLGAIYLQKGDNLKALEFLDNALKLDPNHPQTLLNRTKALFALGYKNQGLEQARALQKTANQQIASQASALLLAYA